MATYYTIDRTNECVPHQTFNLVNVPAPEWLTEDDGSVMQMGTSHHGRRYITEPLVNNPIATSVMIEFIFELIRREHFPTKPSRMRCIFAAETLESANQFRTRYHSGPAKVFNIEYEGNTHRGDMGLLTLVGNMIQVQRNAMAYWCGETYEITPGYQPFWEILIPLPAQLGELVEQY